MWMRIALLLAGLLLWDAATADNGQSTVARGGEALMNIGPVRDLVNYVEQGHMVQDLTTLTSAALVSITPSSAIDAAATSDAVKAARAERRAARQKRQAELHLSTEDVNKIAQAVADLYHDEQAKAEQPASPATVAAPEPGSTPAPATVEKSVAALGPDLLSAIIQASDKTGANSGYLLHIALRESGLKLGAAAPTSSATGPFQFIQQTWYQMLGTYGVKDGFKAETALLKKQANGRYTPISDDAREEVLSLRSDPYVAAVMAGELTMENAATLTRLLGRAPAHGELYAAHVFGPAGAVKLIQTRGASATTPAATILPSAASANRWLFYTSAGTPRSVTALFDELSRFMSTREVATVCNANLNFFGS